MSPAQKRWLALWATLLSVAVCLGFLPVPRLMSVLILLALIGLIAGVWYLTRRGSEVSVALKLDDLPEATYRQPIVLVCGDLPQSWPEQSQVLTLTQGCWIRVEDHQSLEQVARQLLVLRPEWGRQLSVMVCVCPQQHAEVEGLTSRLLAIRWQISQIRRDIHHAVPLVLNAQAGSGMMNTMLWQAAMPGEGIRVWRDFSAPSTISEWSKNGGSPAMQQQVLMNSLMAWTHRHLNAVFADKKPDMPVIIPTATVWGIGPILSGSLASSVWTRWLTRHTAMQHVASWQPVGTDSTVMSLLPDFILPLLPEGHGLTPQGRARRWALGLFMLAAVTSVISSGWANRQLMQRLSFDIQRYNRIPMGNHGLKADAVEVLRQDLSQLDKWARNGEPLQLGLGLYKGEFLRMPVLDAIRTFVPPPLTPPELKPEPVPQPAPQIIRLDSMSLFDSGKSALKPGSTKMLINSLVGVKAKPGWLIVVSGHTDHTGNPQLNQTLSMKRAEAVRDWMRDTGDVPGSCFAVQGYGASRPVATNDTTEGRALNRRVEISLVPQANACLIPGNPQALSQDDDASQHNGE